MVETVDVFSSLDMKKVFMHLCRILFFPLQKRSDRKSLFSMDALKQLYQPVKENHTLSKAFECTKKKKSFNSMHSLCFIVSFAIYK